MGRYVRPFPWIGEYAGKYLTHAVQTYKLTRDKKLLDHLTPFVAELVSLQADDGYLGPWPEDMQFKPGTWDAWGHYHIMIGLLLRHEQTQDAKALACAAKTGDMLCNRFLNTKVRATAASDGSGTERRQSAGPSSQARARRSKPHPTKRLHLPACCRP